MPEQQPVVDLEKAITQEENNIFEKVKQSGEMERLKELLKLRLEENGWHARVSEAFKKTMEEQEFGQLSIPGIVHDMLPIARSEIPTSVKVEVIQQINNFLSKDLEYADLFSITTTPQPTTPPKK